MYDGFEGTFRTIRLRGRQASCPVCGDNPTITELIDYEQFCGARASDKVTLLFYFYYFERLRLRNVGLCVKISQF